MKRLLIFLAALFVSVMSSACINNFAIQELNTKAKEYLDKGDYDEAVKRLESSVDLDGSIFETRYNLAVAYINKEEFASAINQLNQALTLNSGNADAYYTLGVALEGEASKKLLKKNVLQTSEELENDFLDKKEGEETFGTGIFANASDALYAANKLDEAIKAYKKYLEIANGPKDKTEVEEHINELEESKDIYLKEGAEGDI